MLRIILKVTPKTRRFLELALTEQELKIARVAFWDPDDLPEGDDEVRAKLALDLAKTGLDTNQTKVAIAAILAVSLWVGGIYWYKERTPPVRAETRRRAFPLDNGDIVCPHCGYQLTGHSQDETPVDFSKTLKKPRYICPDCNTYVVVSARKQEYQDKNKVEPVTEDT